MSNGYNAKLVRHKLKNARTKFYYMYEQTPSSETDGNPIKRPTVSVCLMQIESEASLPIGDGLWARGVAVCSEDDAPCRAYGRMRARANAAKLLAAKLMPHRHLHRELTDDVKMLLGYEKTSRRPGLPITHIYVPHIQGNEVAEKVIQKANVTAQNKPLSEADKRVENEINPVFTPYELHILEGKKK